MVVGHLGVNVPDLAAAQVYYDQVMPALGFEPFLAEVDEFAYRPANGKPGTYVFFYPSLEGAHRSVRAAALPPVRTPSYFATFWSDPFGFMLEAVCHHDRD